MLTYQAASGGSCASEGDWGRGKQAASALQMDTRLVVPQDRARSAWDEGLVGVYVFCKRYQGLDSQIATQVGSLGDHLHDHDGLPRVPGEGDLEARVSNLRR